MQVYKFQHTIQIIRWLGQAHGNYSLDAWESVAKALKNRMRLENMLSTQMTDYLPLQKEIQIIMFLSKSERTLRKLADIESMFKKNKSDMFSLSTADEEPDELEKKEEQKEANFMNWK